jgi:predicted metal-dependent phosphoesterase TrpH
MSKIKRLAEGMGFEPTKGFWSFNGLAILHILAEKLNSATETLAFPDRKARKTRERKRSIRAQMSAQFVRHPFTFARAEAVR